MESNRNCFESINFNKKWDEEDWERFFSAQDEFVRQVRPGRAYARGRTVDPSLSFRNVMRRFGMDPDGVFAPEASFEPPAGPSTEPPLWKSRLSLEEAEVDALPIYIRAKSFVGVVASLWERRFQKMMAKTYKSRLHRLCQALLEDIRHHARRIPHNVAEGHYVGYGAAAVKGNIARCRRALTHADACVGFVSRLPRRFMSAEEYHLLFRETLGLRNDLMAWIFFLRQMNA
ncbi:MAG TPA: hypothetical protein P5079_02625 [Elusimicrobiota bacterium]|nr:hypothetical protein [Elusimicrobiota bacterium]